MVAKRVNFLVIFLLVSVYLSGIGIAVIFDTDFGNLDVESVKIPDKGRQISGLLYRPAEATAETPLPCVVLVHGIIHSKEMVSGIALELARKGFVALAVDLAGHGNSEGTFGNADPTLGTLAATRYLEAQPYTNASLVGLVGHSLGAGTIRAVAVAHGNILGSVYIGGGFGDMVTDPAYGVLNSTFPKNLLIAIGQHDILFDIDQLKEDLLPVFGNPYEIKPNRLYGDFSNQTARKLITPPTIHLFEPVDSSIVSEIVAWMRNALQDSNQLSSDLIYLNREVAISVSLLAFVGLVFPISNVIFNVSPYRDHKAKKKTKYGMLEDWKTLVIWGTLGLVLFLPMLLIGSLIPIPPMVFGSSLAWWLLSVAIAGLLLILFVLPKFSNVKLNLRSAISETLTPLHVMAALGVFVLLYSMIYLMETLFATNLRLFIIPVFNDLRPIIRILMFVMFVPFFIIYFFVEGIYFHELHNWSAQKPGLISEALAIGKAIGIKVCPYILLICIQYGPMFSLNIRLLPSSIGFLIIFFWGIIPMFIISMAYSWWFYRETSTIGIGAILNSLLFAWSAAATFPLGAFGPFA